MFSVTIDGEDYDLELYSSLSDILEEATDRATEEDINASFTEEDIDWRDSEIPDEYQNEECFDFIQVVNDMDRQHRNKGLEIVTSGLKAGVYLEEIEGSYISEYRSDEDFAQSLCEDSAFTQWPYNCIDWAEAASEIMGDYREHDGHYFKA